MGRFSLETPIEPCRNGHSEWRREADGKWRCRACARTASNKWTAAHREEVSARHRERRYYIEANLQKYGLSSKDKGRMWMLQYQCCAACFEPFELFGRNGAHVDHDHATGKVRSLLCNRCNTTLGRLRDDPIILADLERYLRAYA